jgi:hypothetical protein
MQTSTLLIPIVRAATEDFTAAELAALNEVVQTGRDPHSIGAIPGSAIYSLRTTAAACTAKRASRWQQSHYLA